MAFLRDIKDLWDAGVGELEVRPFDYAQGPGQPLLKKTPSSRPKAGHSPLAGGELAFVLG